MKGLGWLIGFLFVPFVVFGAMNPFLPIYANPYTSYEVVSTPYLNVVYQPGCEYAVNEFLKYADKVYLQMTDFYDVQPYSKLTVVIQNDTNVVNSVTDPVDNVIFIFLNASEDQIFSPSVSSWVRFVFAHELTHILITQKGGLKFLRVYGVPLSTAYNGLMIPAYFQEGLAEYTETYFNDNRGRLNDPIFQMYLREYVLAGNLKGLGGAINYESDGWDPAGAPYLVGGSFIRYIGQTYGATAIKNIVSDFAKSPNDGIPSAISKALNKNFPQIISEWISTQKKDIDEEIKTVGQVFEGIQLTHSGRWTALLNGYGNGKLYYYYEDTSSIPSIKYLNTTDMNSKVFYDLGGFVYDNGYIQSLSVSPNGNNVAFTRIVAQDGGNFDYDHLFILNSKKLINTHLKNVLMTAWISDDKIAYVEENGGLYSIKSFNLKDGNVNTLLSPSYVVITSIGAYGGNVYFSGSYNGKEEIYEIDENGIYKIVTGDYLMRDLTFSENYMIFSASQPNKDGIFNLYAVNLQNGQFYRITNVLGGAFSPQITGNRLFYAGYTQNGYNLFVIDGWKDRLIPLNGVFRLVKNPVDISVDVANVFTSVQKSSRPYKNDLHVLGGGMIPIITPESTSLNAFTYSMNFFGILRDTLGFNTLYTLGNVSSSATYDYITLGFAHYGKMGLNSGLTFSPYYFSFFANVGVPVVGLMLGRDFLFYPSLSYTYELPNMNANKLSVNGTFLWNPSSIPNNSSPILPLYLNAQIDFSGIQFLSTNYDLNLYTSFPFIGNVMGIGTNISNGNLTLSQSFNLSRIYVNLYDVTGTVGLRYVDLSQFASYRLNNNETTLGLITILGIDSFFNQTMPLEIYTAYNFKTNELNYGISIQM